MVLTYKTTFISEAKAQNVSTEDVIKRYNDIVVGSRLQQVGVKKDAIKPTARLLLNSIHNDNIFNAAALLSRDAKLDVDTINELVKTVAARAEKSA